MVASPLEFRTSVSNTPSSGGGKSDLDDGSSSELAPRIIAPRAR